MCQEPLFRSGPWIGLGCANAPPGCADANPATLALIPGSYSLFTFAKLRMYIPSLEPCTPLYCLAHPALYICNKPVYTLDLLVPSTKKQLPCFRPESRPRP